MIRDTAEGVELDVRVVPRARRTAIAGLRDDILIVRLAAPPVEGAANEALVDYLAAWLPAPRRAVRILSGERSRRKRLAIAGASASQLRARLNQG